MGNMSYSPKKSSASVDIWLSQPCDSLPPLQGFEFLRPCQVVEFANQTLHFVGQKTAKRQVKHGKLISFEVAERKIDLTPEGRQFSTLILPQLQCVWK